MHIYCLLNVSIAVRSLKVILCVFESIILLSLIKYINKNAKRKHKKLDVAGFEPGPYSVFFKKFTIFNVAFKNHKNKHINST